MRLHGVAMVRDEADVVEAFVRHNLRLLDGLAIVDHDSLDGTGEILAKLASEGLPLEVRPAGEAAFFQSRHLTALARELFTRERADFVFALDADEFLKVRSRAALESALAAVPPGMHALIHWLTYVPEDLENAERFGPGHLRWRLKEERHAMHKVVVSRALAQSGSAVITDGNHLVAEPSAARPPRHARLPAEVVACAHCPVRSRDQVCAKVITGYLADLAAQAPGREFAHHWRELYREIASGTPISPEMLRDIACNYTLPRAQWRPSAAIERVEDPLPLRVELRYPPRSGPDPLRRLMRVAEALILEQRRERTAASPALP